MTIPLTKSLKKPQVKLKMTVREKEDRLVLIAEAVSRRQPVNY